MSLSTMNKPRVGMGTKKKIDDKFSIKNLIFLHATSNYVIPVDTEGHQVFYCVDCGDKFVCESSYNYHVNRRSVKITYTCRICSKSMVYMNRCNLLSHIRSHVFKTATINLVDLKIEPLPKEDMVFGLFHLGQPLTVDQVLNSELRLQAESIQANDTVYSIQPPTNVDHEETITCMESVKKKPTPSEKRKKSTRSVKCIECDATLRIQTTVTETRRKHYMSPPNSGAVSTCPICSYKLPTACAVNVHIRMHESGGVNCICPECGEYARTNHLCGGFKAVKMAVQAYCPADGCGLFPVQEFFYHFMKEHMKCVYKCSMCTSACFTESALRNHVASKHPDSVLEAMHYFQCSCCPGRLVLKHCLSSHIQTHLTSLKHVLPCKKCGMLMSSVSEFQKHLEHCNGNKNQDHKTSESRNEKSSGWKQSRGGREGIIKCPKCDLKLSGNWVDVKKHFALKHKEHKCVDVKLQLQKLEAVETAVRVKTYKRKRRMRSTEVSDKIKDKRRRKNIPHTKVNETEKGVSQKQDINNKYACLKCGDTTSTTSESFKDHILTHRDPSTAYQCMECGFCFVVKPSFSTHLFVAHGIKDADEYIKTNQCFNEEAFKIVDSFLSVTEEPLKDNQCKICREQFSDEDTLSKHFRVHGMAFIMTKKQIN